MLSYQKTLLAKARGSAWSSMTTAWHVDGEIRRRAADETHVTGVPTPQVSASHQLRQSPSTLLVVRQEVDAVNVEL